jgi:hypothetical protein
MTTDMFLLSLLQSRPPVLFLMAYLRISNTSNTIVTPNGAPDFTPYFYWVRLFQSFSVYYVVIHCFCFVLFLLAIALSFLLQVSPSDYPICHPHNFHEAILLQNMF